MSSALSYEVAIIGGGLAGLCAAIGLARAGRKVVVIEKNAYPFHRVCGEYISLESWDYLQRLGIDLKSLQLPIIKKLVVTDVFATQYRFALPLGGFGISRFLLDDLLAKEARNAGVALLEKTTVQQVNKIEGGFEMITRDKTLNAALALGCWGKRSNVDLQWKRPFIQANARGLNGYIGIKYHIHYPHPQDEIVLHNFKNGYCGMSAIEAGKSCLCYLARSEDLKKFGSIEAMERELLSQNPALRHIFSNAEFLYPEPMTISNVSFQQKASVENGTLMLGDAAGLITPLCGNGMSMAMHGAALATGLIDQFLWGKMTRQTLEIQYEAQWQSLFAGRLRTGRMVQRFFGGNQSTKWALKLLQALPPLANTIIKSTHGKPF